MRGCLEVLLMYLVLSQKLTLVPCHKAFFCYRSQTVLHIRVVFFKK